MWTSGSRQTFFRWLAVGGIFGAGWVSPSSAQTPLETAPGESVDSTCAQTVVHVDVASDVQGCPSDADVASRVNALTARESTVGATRRAQGCPPAEAGSLTSNQPISNGPK